MKKPPITIDGYGTAEELQRASSLFSKSLEIIRRNGFRWFLYLAYTHMKIDYLSQVLWPLYKKIYKDRLILKKIQGYYMYLDPTDNGLSKQLACGGVREMSCVKCLKKVLRKGMVTVDIGANLGYYALMEAHIVGNKGKVYAFEPHPKNFEIFMKNVERNGYQNIIEGYQVAVGEKKGIAKLAISENRSNRHRIVHSEYEMKNVEREWQHNEYIEVDMITLDDFFKDKERKPNLIRMDVEGYENMIIDGAIKTLKESGPPLILFIEIHPFLTNTKELQEKLVFLGFEPIWYVSYFDCIYKLSKEDLLNLNLAPGYIFLRKT